jgi:perosamine synthetase
VGCSVHFIPLHLHPYYRNTCGYLPADFPIATAAFERIVSLPLYPKMMESDIERVVSVIRTIIQGSRR